MRLAGPADLDVKPARGAGALGRERDERHVVARPSRRFAVIGGNPQRRVGLAAVDEAARLETPGVVLRIAAAKAGARRKAGHPAADLRDARGAAARADRHAGEARRRVEVGDKACSVSTVSRRAPRPHQTTTPKCAAFSVSASAVDLLERRRRRARSAGRRRGRATPRARRARSAASRRWSRSPRLRPWPRRAWGRARRPCAARRSLKRGGFVQRQALEQSPANVR